MKEIWKNIDGYEGLYQVSNLGRVKSLEKFIYDTINRTQHNKERILKPGKSKTGYLQVILCKDRKIKTFSVHRLVAMTFLENPNNLETVHHIDEDKTNNKVSNLEWTTQKKNVQYSCGIKIKCLDIKTNETIYFSSINEAANFLNTECSVISYSLYISKKPYKKRFIFSEI